MRQVFRVAMTQATWDTGVQVFRVAISRITEEKTGGGGTEGEEDDDFERGQWDT